MDITYSLFKRSNKMSDDIFLINEAEDVALSAGEVFKKTVGLTMKDDNLCVVFSTVQNKKGYGKQYIPVDQLQNVLSVLKDAVENGIHKDTETPTTAETVKRSLIQDDNGIRFKTEHTKGKKPTLVRSEQDFSDFVSTLETYAPKIQQKVAQLKSR